MAEEKEEKEEERMGNKTNTTEKKPERTFGSDVLFWADKWSSAYLSTALILTWPYLSAIQPTNQHPEAKLLGNYFLLCFAFLLYRRENALCDI